MKEWVIGAGCQGEIGDFLLDWSGKEPGRVVCFDYFDTLFTRNIEPEATKRVAAGVLSQVLHGVVSGAKLYEIRRQLEPFLCRENDYAGLDPEFNLAEFGRYYFFALYQQFADLLTDWTPGRFIQTVLEIELAVELQVQTPCRETLDVARELKEQGRKIVLISDFYLPKEWFQKMVAINEVADLFDHLYVSAEYRLKKASGRLYDHVCRDLDCPADKMIMIGDNLHADGTMAAEAGLMTLTLKPLEEQTPDNGGISVDSRTWTSASVAAEFSRLLIGSGPFREMGSSLWLFICRLFQQLMRDGTRDVFFFSKEGEFLRSLFDQFQQEVIGYREINSHYLLVSRKATFLASLRPLAEEDFARLFTYYHEVSLLDFLQSLNVETSIAENICEELGLDGLTRFPGLKHHPIFQTLISSVRFQKEYERRRVFQRQNFIRYLDSFGVAYRRDGLTIVDVGWKGSIQDNVYHILQGEVPLQGYFIGSLIATEWTPTNLKKGLLFDDIPQPTPFFNVYNNNRSLFEMLLGATHGSADGYFTPDQYEGLPSDHQRMVYTTIQDDQGTLHVTSLDLPEERELFERMIRPLQKKTLHLASRMNRIYLMMGCTLPDEEWFARQHARMVFLPEEEEIDLFEEMYHLENFGIFEYTTFQRGEEVPLLMRYRNLCDIRENSNILETGVWPPIILRRLGLGSCYRRDGEERYQREFGK